VRAHANLMRTCRHTSCARARVRACLLACVSVRACVNLREQVLPCPRVRACERASASMPCCWHDIACACVCEHAFVRMPAQVCVRKHLCEQRLRLHERARARVPVHAWVCACAGLTQEETVFVKKIEGFGQSHLFSMAAPSHCGLPHARCAVPEYSAWPGDAEARSLSRSMQATLASALPCGLKVSAGGWSRDTLPANKRRLIAQLQRLDSSYPGGLRMSAPRPPLAAPSAHPNARRGTNRSRYRWHRALPHPA